MKKKPKKGKAHDFLLRGKPELRELVKVEVRKIPPSKAKRGPKPRHGKGKPCTRRSLSIPDDLWEWCEERAGKREQSVSAYIVMVLKNRRLRFEKLTGVHRLLGD